MPKDMGLQPVREELGLEIGGERLALPNLGHQVLQRQTAVDSVVAQFLDPGKVG
jgi:hypothetical protein